MEHIYTIDTRDIKTEIPISRIAARAIIKRNDLYLLVYLEETQEYKLPGGGVTKDEDLIEALKREVLEETGYTVINVLSCIGYIDIIKDDIFNVNQIYYMRNIYYVCDVSDNFIDLLLDKYESDLGFKPVWVSIDEAINVNKKRLLDGTKYHWTERTLQMLTYIKNRKDL